MWRIAPLVLAAALLAGGGSRAEDLFELYGEPTERARRIQLAVEALRAKDFATAQRISARLTREMPYAPAYWRLLGAAQIGAEDWRAARVSYTRALRLDPSDPVSHAGLGVALARQGRPEAREQLDWLARRAQACAAVVCGQATQLAALREGVERALKRVAPQR